MKSENRALTMGYLQWTEFEPTTEVDLAKERAVLLKKEGFFATTAFRVLSGGTKEFIVMYRIPKKKKHAMLTNGI